MGASAAAGHRVLAAPVTCLPGVGPVVATKLERLGITSIRDLLFHWPRSWQDLTRPVPIALVRRDAVTVLVGTLHDITLEAGKGKRKLRVTAQLRDAAGDQLTVVWFNQAYLAKSLKEGQSAVLVGMVTWDWSAKRLALMSPKIESEAKILPIYPETAGLTSKTIRSLTQPLLEHLFCPDPIGERVTPGLVEAMRILHAPDDQATIGPARRRLALDELCALQYEVLRRRRELERLPGLPVGSAVAAVQRVSRGLPFALSDGQRRAAWTIMQDLAREYPMSRLLLGDVGSGKTVVAALAAVPVLEAGYHVAWMAPTQVLARQLADRLTSMLGPHGYRTALVVGGQIPEVSSAPTLWVGTHALASLSFESATLGLVVIDEQHRFGVRQRRALVRGASQLPHVLTMSATPIPRSLALTLYGDLDIATLAGVVAHRAGVMTEVLAESGRSRAFTALGQAVRDRRQGFVVVPRIQPGEDGSASLQGVAHLYQAALPAVRIGVYHGQQTAAEQRKTMEAFLDGQLDVLVATTIVEVGIDVPNATVMVIEEADRFGLAQLHQLRGRVGRGEYRGQCLLLSSRTDELAQARLTALVESDDGMALAELDLAQRGPGDLLGQRQAGLPQLRLASVTDLAMLEEARSIVRPWLTQPPETLPEWLELYGGEARHELGSNVSSTATL